MSFGVSLTLHTWRGVGPEVQQNLFFYGFRLGFATVSVERDSVLEAYRKLRQAMVERVSRDDEMRQQDEWEER